jgi:hypothetical protein
MDVTYKLFTKQGYFFKGPCGGLILGCTHLAQNARSVATSHATCLFAYHFYKIFKQKIAQK